MKLFKLTALSALLMITLSGCSLNSESPEQQNYKGKTSL